MPAVPAEECLLNHNRNPQLGREEIEGWLCRMLGVQVRGALCALLAWQLGTAAVRACCEPLAALPACMHATASVPARLPAWPPCLPCLAWAAEGHLAAERAGG